MPKHSLVVPVIVRADYRVGYEYADGMTFGHCTVSRWTPAVARAFRRDIDALQELSGTVVYVVGVPEQPLQPKFLARIGFTVAGTCRDPQGRTVPIYERLPPRG